MFRRFGVAGVLVALLVLGGMQMCSGGTQRLTGDGAVGEGTTTDSMKSFVSFVLDDAQASWQRRFAARGDTYAPAKLVLFTGRVDSACGLASAAVGPFYCPSDSKVYIDLRFYEELRRKFGAPGDFAQAYVIAHEIGHHVQNLRGELSGSNKAGDQGGAVRTELQADCYAGVWAHDAQIREVLEVGDVEEALGAAAAIGDDTLQRRSEGTVRPESWTHGSAEQRVRWFERGLSAGDIAACDTVAAQQL
jgi:hypothetical protein